MIRPTLTKVFVLAAVAAVVFANLSLWATAALHDPTYAAEATVDAITDPDITTGVLAAVERADVDRLAAEAAVDTLTADTTLATELRTSVEAIYATEATEAAADVPVAEVNAAVEQQLLERGFAADVAREVATAATPTFVAANFDTAGAGVLIGTFAAAAVAAAAATAASVALARNRYKAVANIAVGVALTAGPQLILLAVAPNVRGTNWGQVPSVGRTEFRALTDSLFTNTTIVGVAGCAIALVAIGAEKFAARDRRTNSNDAVAVAVAQAKRNVADRSRSRSIGALVAAAVTKAKTLTNLRSERPARNDDKPFAHDVPTHDLPAGTDDWLRVGGLGPSKDQDQRHPGTGPVPRR